MPGFRRVLSGLLTLALVLFGWMTYDNVYSPLEPIQALAEQTACTVKDCQKRHAATKTDRNTFGQTFEYTWESGTLVVSCHRASQAFGPRVCELEQ
jgi:hypothetical protein